MEKNTHTQTLSQTALSPQLFNIQSFTFTTQLCHQQSFTTQLCHTQPFTHSLSDALFHTQLCHTGSFTHTILSHKIIHTQFCHKEFLNCLILHHLISSFFFLCAASTTFPEYWKTLIYGVIRSYPVF